MPRLKPIVQAVSFIRDIHSGLDGPALMDKYRLSKLGLGHALHQLEEYKLVSGDELSRLWVSLEERSGESCDPQAAPRDSRQLAGALGPADQDLVTQLTELSEQPSEQIRSSAGPMRSTYDMDGATSSFWIALVCMVLVGLVAWELSDSYLGQRQTPQRESNPAAEPDSPPGLKRDASNKPEDNEPTQSAGPGIGPTRGIGTSGPLGIATNSKRDERLRPQAREPVPDLTRKPSGDPVRASSLEELLKSAEELVFEVFAPASKQKGGAADQLALDERASIAVAKGDSKALIALIREGAKVDARNLVGGTLLIQAVFKGDAEVVSLLLEKGADIDAQGWSGGGALATAAVTGRIEVMKLLLDKGAKVDSVDRMGNTPLMLAAISGHPSVIPILLDNGADMDARNRVGMTPLICAAAFGNTEVVKQLISRGAELHTKDAMGETALSRADGQGHKNIVKLLKATGR